MAHEPAVAATAVATSGTVRPRATTPHSSAAVRAAANDAASDSRREERLRPGDPMLLVYEERVRTLRLVADVVRSGLARLLGRDQGAVPPAGAMVRGEVDGHGAGKASAFRDVRSS